MALQAAGWNSILNILIESSTDVHKVDAALADALRRTSCRYFRFNPEGKCFALELDSSDRSKLEAIQEDTKAFIAADALKFTQVAELLSG